VVLAKAFNGGELAMQDDEHSGPGKNRSGRGDPDLVGNTTSGPDLVPDATATLERMEKLLNQIRGTLDAAARAGEHREFSVGRTVGWVLQIIVAGLVVLALLDWLLAAPTDSLLVKLAFAAVLQLSALTAFLVSAGES
jgi:hypothetical protein